MSSSSSSHMDEASESENEYDYDDLDEDEEIEDDDAAADDDDEVADDDDGDDEADPDLTAGGGSRLFDLSSTLHGVVNELRRLHRAPGDADGIDAQGLLNTALDLSQSMAARGRSLMLPSQSLLGDAGLGVGLAGGGRAGGSAAGGGSDAPLPPADRVHPILRRVGGASSWGGPAVTRPVPSGRAPQALPGDPRRPGPADGAGAGAGSIRSLLDELESASNVLGSAAADTPAAAAMAESAVADVTAPAPSLLVALGEANLLEGVAAGWESGGGAGDSGHPASTSPLLRGPRDESRPYRLGDGNGSPYGAYPPGGGYGGGYGVSRDPVEAHWVDGPRGSSFDSGGFTALLWDDRHGPALSTRAANRSRPSDRGQAAFVAPASREVMADAATSGAGAGDGGAAAERAESLRNMFISRIEATLGALRPVHAKVQKRKELFDAARQAAADAEAKAAQEVADAGVKTDEEKVDAARAAQPSAEAEAAAAEAAGTGAAQTGAAQTGAAGTDAAGADAAGVEGVRPAVATAAPAERESVDTVAAVRAASFEGVPAEGAAGGAAATTMARGQEDSAAADGEAAVRRGDGMEDVRDGGLVPPAAAGTVTSMTRLVEERAASIGVSLEDPANEDPDVVAAAVASTGIDPTFLSALPEEMRTEVLTQHFAQVTNGREAELADLSATTILNQDFLVALPPALRADVLEQEANYRSRNEPGNANAGTPASGGAGGGGGGGGVGSGGDGAVQLAPGLPADADIATFLATLTPDLREEIMLTLDNSLVAQLPAQMAAEARTLRERESARRESLFVNPFGTAGVHEAGELGDARAILYGGVRDPLRVARRSGPAPLGSGRDRAEARAAAQMETTWQHRRDRGDWVRVPPSEEPGVPPLCGNGSLRPLVNLLRLHSSQYGKSLLHQVLVLLCRRLHTRRFVLKLLFDALPRAPRQGPAGTSAAQLTAPPSCTSGSTTDAVVIRRALELLSNLCRHERHVAEDVIAIPCDMEAAAGLAYFLETGEGGGHSPAAALVGLLAHPLFRRSSVHQEQLLALLSYAFNALPPPTADLRSGDAAKEDARSGPGSDAMDEQRTPVTADGDVATGVATDVANGQEEEVGGGEAKAGSEAGEARSVSVPVPVQFRVPCLGGDDLRALTDVLLQEGASEKTYDRVTAVLGQVGLLPGNKERALAALSSAASALGKAVASSFELFASGQGSGVGADGRSLALREFSMAASANELKFLRVTKAIAVLLRKPPPAPSGGSVADAGRDPDGDAVEQQGLRPDCFVGVDDLWRSLDLVLDMIHNDEAPHGDSPKAPPATPVERLEAEVRLRAVEQRARAGAVAAGGRRRDGDGNGEDFGARVVSARGGHARASRAHSLSPALARLSPVIESFFVYHGARADGEATLSIAAAPSNKARAASSVRSPSACSASSDAAPEPLLPGCRELGAFIKRHRVAVNSILRVNPLQLDGSFRPALRHAHAIDFDNKKSYFRGLIRKRGAESQAGSLRITIRRDRVFDDSYHQLRSHTAEEMRGRLHVQFNGEEGIDAGGVTREWYVILARQIFDPNYALFCRSAAKAATYQPNKSSFINQEHLDNFRFVGRIFGKAIYDGQLLDAYFTRAFYKHILGIRPTYHDIEGEDPSYYQSLCWILDNDITNVIDEAFCSEYEEFGQRRIVDLKPNGRNVPVTEENKEEYVRLVTEVKLTKAIEQQIAAFKEGFHELIPLEDCRIFNEVELELLASGLPDIDVADLKANVEYSGYTAGSPQISWFWSAVGKMGQEDLARLVMFVTGTSKVPLEGFASLQGMNGPQKFQIHRASGEHKTRLPSAHTCFNQLDLPEYDDAATLAERLLVATRECSVGFGFS
jgi:hypothetical protein